MGADLSSTDFAHRGLCQADKRMETDFAHRVLNERGDPRIFHDDEWGAGIRRRVGLW